jgi:hypothetical protein
MRLRIPTHRHTRISLTRALPSTGVSRVVSEEVKNGFGARTIESLHDDSVVYIVGVKSIFCLM